MNQTDTEPSDDDFSRPQRSLPEWMTFAIALAIVGALVGLILYEWRTQEDSPPILAVAQSSLVREDRGQFYVPFAITNKGGQTVESVQVIAELEVNGEVIESGEQQIDFLANDETQEGAFVFNRDPRSGELTVRVASYKLP